MTLPLPLRIILGLAITAVGLPVALAVEIAHARRDHDIDR